MTVRSKLIATATVVLAIALPASLAQAAPTKVGTAADLYELGIDGGTLVWDNDRAVTTVDIASGASSIVFRAPRGTMIYDVEVGGGTISVLTRKYVKRKSTTKAYVLPTTGGATRVVASGTAKYSKNAPVCGTEIQLGRVGASGEALVIRNKYSLSKKLCKKPDNLQSDVLGASLPGSRVVFTGRYTANNPLVKLGLVFDADMVGSTLLMTGFTVGALDTSTNKFVTVTTERQNTFVFGRLDKSGNVLVTELKGSKGVGSFELIEALSGYSAITPIEAGVRGVVWEPCGDYLVREKYDLGKNQTSGISVRPSPFAPAGLASSTPLPEGINQPLWAAACDGTNVAYAITPVGGSNAPSLYVAPLAG